jgi:hypothetical protein
MPIGLTDDFALFNSLVRLTTVFSEQADFTGEADFPQVDLLASFPSVGIQARRDEPCELAPRRYDKPLVAGSRRLRFPILSSAWGTHTP